MPKLGALTSHPRFALHGCYFFLALLIVLFLILSAVSGPGTKYYWLRLTSVDGARWWLGGLGTCGEGGPCPADGAHAEAVRGCLMWHLAVAVIFTALSAVQAALVLRPPASSPLLTSWLTFLLPPIGFLMVSIVLITDFAVRANITSAEDVEVVETQGSFWLSTAATALCLVWVGIAEYAMWRERQARRKREQEETERLARRKRRKADLAKKESEEKKGFVARFNPWG